MQATITVCLRNYLDEGPRDSSFRNRLGLPPRPRGGGRASGQGSALAVPFSAANAHPIGGGGVHRRLGLKQTHDPLTNTSAFR